MINLFFDKPLVASLLFALAIIIIPYLPLGAAVGFAAAPLPLLLGMVGMAILYGLVVEVTKGMFFRRFKL